MKMMVTAAEVMVMVVETASLAEVVNVEMKMKMMVAEAKVKVMVVETDFVYGVILIKGEEKRVLA